MTRGGVQDTRLETKTKAKDTKKSEAKAQGQECLRPRPKDQGHKMQVFPKKKVLKNFFRSISKKRSRKIFFSRSAKILTIKKMVLSLSRGQANLSRTWGFNAKAKDLKIVSSRPKTSSRTPPLPMTQVI